MAGNSGFPWGHYSPPKGAWFLRLVTAAGFGRGKFKRKIIESWQKHFGYIYDVTVRGVKYRLDISDNVTDKKILTSSKVYDKEELGALLHACAGGIFVDIGANIGYYSLHLAVKGNSRVVAIEPNPPTLERLQYNIAINGLQEMITVVPKGIGPEGTHDLYSGKNLGSSSFHDDPNEETCNITSVETTPLLSLFEKLAIQEIDGIKIDIEGMEDQALVPFFRDAPDALWPKCIVIEHGHEHFWREDVYEVLRKKGYTQTHRTRGNFIFHLRGA